MVRLEVVEALAGVKEDVHSLTSLNDASELEVVAADRIVTDLPRIEHRVEVAAEDLSFEVGSLYHSSMLNCA